MTEQSIAKSQVSPTQSLTFKTLINMALRLTLVVLAISAIGYWHLMSQLAHDTRSQLLDYITERGQREEAVFVTAQTNHDLLRQEFLDQWTNRDRRNGEVTFDRQFFQWSDRTVRNVPEKRQFDGFDSKHHPTTFVQPDVDLNADFKTRLALSYNLVEQYALGWQTNFLNTYISLPEGAVNVYIPGVDYGISAPTDYDIRAEEWLYLGDAAHNPERKTLWTGVYRDSVMDKWVVSAETPIDSPDGRHLGTIGHDIVLNDLIARAIDDRLDGTYNVLVRADGQLIAAPQMMDAIQAEAGKLTVQKTGDLSLQHQFSLAQQTGERYSVVYNPDDREYLAIARLKGPDWYLIAVYPEQLLQNQALNNTWYLLAVGLASLILEILLLFIVLRRQIANPLKSLLGATEQVTAGNFAIDLNMERQDELGQLARAFAQMTHRLQGTFTDLEQKIIEQQQAEALIVEKNHALEQALQEREQMQLQTIQNQKKMSELGNLVAGVAHEINNPTSFLKGNIQPAREYTQDLFQLVDFFLQKYPNDPEVRAELEEIEFEFICEDLPQLLDSMNLGIDRIQAISSSLRTFSRTDREHKTEFDLHDGINSSLLILKHRTKGNEKRPAIEIIKNYDMLPKIACFPGQLNQVFMNLLANAIDAFEEVNRDKTFAEIKANPNRIEIETQKLDDGRVQISIADNAIGMKPETVDRIFEQGFTTKDVGKGTGLGMAIAHQIVTEKHGGTISCTSTLGQGTMFTIVLSIT